MDAVLLMLEAAAAVLVLLWVAARQGEGGLLGWKPSTPPAASQPKAGTSPPALRERP